MSKKNKDNVCASCNSTDRVEFRGQQHNEYGSFYIGYNMCDDCTNNEHRIFSDGVELGINIEEDII